jgi:hypothetical protein
VKYVAKVMVASSQLPTTLKPNHENDVDSLLGLMAADPTNDNVHISRGNRCCVLFGINSLLRAWETLP